MRQTATEDGRIERLARRRAGAKLGWLIHALVYVCVNAALALLTWHTKQSWALYPLAGWGLGLAIHGLAVWLGSGTGLHERLLQAERDKLARTPRI
ncbi:2TM domain-containing protein [Comamonas flocculans]|uniref:2TM domain-containing protein n=1 Tax=Comamonas flocculans TaxID=2597701 RepID=A0A5B8RUZ4_9BURK|nr:2TM domain-containing protein [Comamonas flocculans]QEA12055.1 2TM domain-containing protein [Comamonas flocculans]